MHAIIAGPVLAISALGFQPGAPVVTTAFDPYFGHWVSGGQDLRLRLDTARVQSQVFMYVDVDNGEGWQEGAYGNFEAEIMRCDFCPEPEDWIAVDGRFDTVASDYLGYSSRRMIQVHPDDVGGRDVAFPDGGLRFYVIYDLPSGTSIAQLEHWSAPENGRFTMSFFGPGEEQGDWVLVEQVIWTRLED